MVNQPRDYEVSSGFKASTEVMKPHKMVIQTTKTVMQPTKMVILLTQMVIETI